MVHMKTSASEIISKNGIPERGISPILHIGHSEFPSPWPKGETCKTTLNTHRIYTVAVGFYNGRTLLYRESIVFEAGPVLGSLILVTTAMKDSASL
jgi:hypothetical protein